MNKDIDGKKVERQVHWSVVKGEGPWQQTASTNSASCKHPFSSQLPELQSAMRYFTEYRDNCLLCFIKTCLKDTIDDALLKVDGFGDPV